MPTAAAVAVICASTAISGVVGGLGWLSYVVVVTAVIAATGTALRALRVPAALIWVGQVLVLLCLAVTLFTNSGLFVILPGPTALHDLGTVFTQAGADVQTGVPPVPQDQPILCLVMMSIGLVAVAVDMLAVTARVPAAAGLILLCVYAVPASLDDSLLPWWSFVLGAAAFTVMLAVDGVARHQVWRGKLGLPAVATTGVAPATIAITAVGLVIALFVGGTFTIVGTVGRLPGAAGGGDGGTGALGIKPFTVLSGMLDQKATTELFDVTGLPTNAPYLQALTLDKYVPSQGFVPNTQMPSGVPATGPLPAAPGQEANDALTKLTISAVNWQDVWLPVYGMPSRIQGVSPEYRYDNASGIVYSESTRRPGNYTEQADLTLPSPQELESAGVDYTGVGAKYRQISGVSPLVRNLARQITSNASSEFDMTQDVYNFFRGPGSGFTYSTATGPSVTGDPLVDFLFKNKTGFCEQYSTAMAVMLRALGIPTRVAIGFTDGYPSQGRHVITSQDAHAWDEVYFPGYGWVTFDPTPLSDGRTQVPGFVSTPQNSGTGQSTGRQNPDKPNGRASTVAPPPTTKQAPATAAVPNTGGGWSGPPVWQLGTVLGLLLVAGASTYFVRSRVRPAALGRVLRVAAVPAWCLLAFFAAALLSWWLSALVVVLGLAATPAGVREWRRRRRHRAVMAQGPQAANAAWAELLAESWDRGTEVQRGDTIRVSASRMAREHDLDSEGRQGLQTLVGEVERSWYGSPDTTRRPTPVVEESFERVRVSIHRNAPLPWRARLLPRSVLRPMRARPKGDGDEEES
jgi:transglutaminase-like putative cysteine protease